MNNWNLFLEERCLENAGKLIFLNFSGQLLRPDALARLSEALTFVADLSMRPDPPVLKLQNGMEGFTVWEHDGSKWHRVKTFPMPSERGQNVSERTP